MFQGGYVRYHVVVGAVVVIVVIIRDVRHILRGVVSQDQGRGGDQTASVAAGLAEYHAAETAVMPTLEGVEGTVAGGADAGGWVGLPGGGEAGRRMDTADEGGGVFVV